MSQKIATIVDWLKLKRRGLLTEILKEKEDI